MASRVLKDESRSKVLLRSDRMCEAMIANAGVWSRCWQAPVEVHHLLTRARGGALLDRVGEDYHLIALCHWHHTQSDGEQAYLTGLLISGTVSWHNREDRPLYTGPDEYLTAIYGEHPNPRKYWFS